MQDTQRRAGLSLVAVAAASIVLALLFVNFIGGFTVKERFYRLFDASVPPLNFKVDVKGDTSFAVHAVEYRLLDVYLVADESADDTMGVFNDRERTGEPTEFEVRVFEEKKSVIQSERIRTSGIYSSGAKTVSRRIATLDLLPGRYTVTLSPRMGGETLAKFDRLSLRMIVAGAPKTTPKRL